jgi:3',5'-cyclic AMP phosphodiesterase CpdA
MEMAMREKNESALANGTRRGLLKCMLLGAAGGVLWTVSGGVPRAFQLGGDALGATPPAPGDFAFVQISDTHIGFHGEANPDPSGTLRLALARIADAPVRPAMMVHTGDVSHLSKPAEFDAAQQLLKSAGLDTHFIPGEHDTLGDDGKSFFEHFGAETRTGGWYSFDQGGVHFVALVNVLNLRPGGLGYLGPEQLAWLKNDLKGRSASTPLVVLAHMPLWSVSPEWSWGTDDAAEAISYLRPFDSVTVLNGHIHQVIQKVEGGITFQTALSTAYPQAAAGTPGASPGPLKVPAERLKSMLGVRQIHYVKDKTGPAIDDARLNA